MTPGAPIPTLSTLGVPLSAEQMREQVNAIQRLMEAVMKEGEHYGRIPGSRKPSLWKPGAEKLCVAFHIECAFAVEDLSTPGSYRYRVKCTGTHQHTGIKLGEGMGACSSMEQKFKWRRATDVEFDNTPAKRRRLKYYYDRDKLRPEEVKQVRSEHEDLENTILKMACKRAHVAMTLNVTAASDIFTQDIEDLPERLREAEDAPSGAPLLQVKQPERRSKTSKKPKKVIATASEVECGPIEAAPSEGTTSLSEGQQRILRLRMAEAALSDEALKERFGSPLAAIAAGRFNEIAAWVRDVVEARG